MLHRLTSWWTRQRRDGALHGIVIGLGLSAIGALVYLSSARPSPPKELSRRAQTELSRRAAELAPEVVAYARQLALRTRELDESDDSSRQRYCDWIVAWSANFRTAVDAEVARCSTSEHVRPEEVRRFFYERLRSETGACVFESSSGATPRTLFASPRVAVGTIQDAIEASMQKLLTIFPTASPQGQEGVKKAILAHRKAIAPFDTKPLTITFDAPSQGAIVNAVPFVEFTMTDSGSGPDPDSRKLIAVNTGPVAQQSIDLTSLTQVVLNDPMYGKIVVTAGVPEEAL